MDYWSKKNSHKNLLIALKYYQSKNLLSEKFKKEILKSVKTNKLNSKELEEEERLVALKKINHTQSTRFILVDK